MAKRFVVSLQQVQTDTAAILQRVQESGLPLVVVENRQAVAVLAPADGSNLPQVSWLELQTQPDAVMTQLQESTTGLSIMQAQTIAARLMPATEASLEGVALLHMPNVQQAIADSHDAVMQGRTIRLSEVETPRRPLTGS